MHKDPTVAYTVKKSSGRPSLHSELANELSKLTTVSLSGNSQN